MSSLEKALESPFALEGPLGGVGSAMVRMREGEIWRGTSSAVTHRLRRIRSASEGGAVGCSKWRDTTVTDSRSVCALLRSDESCDVQLARLSRMCSEDARVLICGRLSDGVLRIPRPAIELPDSDG